MTILRNTPFQSTELQDFSLAYGRNALAPDAGGGFATFSLPGFTQNSFFQAGYDADAPFNNANAGRLQTFYDPGAQTLTILSTNVADDNTVRWFAIR